MQAILFASLLQLFFIVFAMGLSSHGTDKACSSSESLGQNACRRPVIFPQYEDYIINGTQSFTLKCYGKNFVTWTPPDIPSEHIENRFPKYSKITIKSFQKPDNNYPYATTLTITNASYLDVGYYYCHENTTDFNDLSRVSRIYIYVNDTTTLSLLSELPTWLKVLEHSEVVIPCRPTSPDVKVELRLITGEEVLLNKENQFGMFLTDYDPKKGYTMSNVRNDLYNRHHCVFSRGDDDQYVTTAEDVHYNYFSPPKPLLQDISDGHTKVRQKLILKCILRYDEEFSMDWIVPNKNGTQVISKKRQITIRKGDDYVYVQHLEIENTTIADEGEYTCIVKNEFGENNDTKFIKINPMKPFINLTVENEIYGKRAEAGQPSVQWRINVNAHPTPKLIWYDNKNNEIQPALKTNDNSKYVIEIEDGKAASIKINNITIFDWGYYKLKAINDFEEKTIKLFLNVTDKPSVDIQMKPFYYIHESNIIRCEVAAHPAATINWFYKPCLDRGCNYTHVLSDRVVTRGPLQTAYLNFTANHTGHVLCTANNSLGSKEVFKRFFVRDINNGYGIWGLDEDTIKTKNNVSRYRVAVGDDVTIYCAASHYNYTNDLKWYKQVNGDAIVLEKNDHYDIENGLTKYSNEVALIILNVSYNDSGKYLCVVENKTILDVRVNYTVIITVRDPEKPSFILTNLNNTDLVTMSPTRLEMTCMARGIPKPTITWYKNGEEILKTWSEDKIELVQNQQVLIFKYTDPEDEGTYACKATNKIGSDQRQARLKFKNKPGFDYIYIIIVVVLTLLFVFVLILVFIKFMKKTDDRSDGSPMAELPLK